MKILSHEFVDLIPDVIENDVVYVSIKHRTAIHKCCCGCGEEVVTPLSPAGWEVTFNGVSISVYPSIGNWNSKCQSHYFITNNKVEWARKWSAKRIAKKKIEDEKDRQDYYSKNDNNER